MRIIKFNSSKLVTALLSNQLSKLIRRAVPLLIQWSLGTDPVRRSAATIKDGRPLDPALLG